MPDRPLILFPKYEEAEKAKRHGGSSNIHYPNHGRQVTRLTPQFNVLQKALDNGRIIIKADSSYIEPEYTLVLEVAGNPDGFNTAVNNLRKDYENVEWLFELVDSDGDSDNDFFALNSKGERADKALTYKYFCVLTNQRALEEILSLWNNYIKDDKYKFPTGKTGLRNVFQTLKDIHIWGVSERLEETGLLEAWFCDLQDLDLPAVFCEIELFFRSTNEKRIAAQEKVREIVEEIGGKVITYSTIEEIQYHAILASIPRVYAEKIIAEKDVLLTQMEQVMFFKPTGQTVVSSSNEEGFNYTNSIDISKSIMDDPVIAIFDGLPQENHPLLKGLLIIDDPDNFANDYQVKDRLHGTSMASLVAHGNLDEYYGTTIRKLYVRPIMTPYATGPDRTKEFIPEDMLIVDQIHIAVRRLFEADAGNVAPTIRIINLSIGLGDRLYYNMISPLAKLLDWLSYKYRILFVVSAGNHSDDLDLEMPFSVFKELDEMEKNKNIINIINKHARNNKLLSPAESMNALTVGALFKDNSSFSLNYRQVVPCTNGMISPISSIGCGINRSIKPDILFDGGQSLLTEKIVQNNLAEWKKFGTNAPPGILSAKPLDIKTGTLKVAYSFGTSDSAALISHNLSLCYEALEQIFQDELNSSLPQEYAAILLKAMIIHGAQWGELADLIRQTLNLSGRAADDLHRWMGYGMPDVSKVKECTKHRITLIGYGDLKQDKAHVFELPLPFDFHTRETFRHLTVTLAFFTPIKPTTQKYRTSQLWFTIDDGNKKLVPTRLDASDKAVTRGTVQHEHFVGDKRVVWDENDSLKIKISSRADANDFDDEIPYALFVSFEIAPELDIDVYGDILDKIEIAYKTKVTS